MLRLCGTNVIARLLRLIVAVSCVVPCASPRLIAAPIGSLPLPSPVTPVNEEDETEREEVAEEQIADPPQQRIPKQPQHASGRLKFPLTNASSCLHAARDGPTTIDHFRNGLGTPYRC